MNNSMVEAMGFMTKLPANGTAIISSSALSHVNQCGQGKVRNQVILSRARKAKGRESPFFKITTQTPTFTNCNDEPRNYPVNLNRRPLHNFIETINKSPI